MDEHRKKGIHPLDTVNLTVLCSLKFPQAIIQAIKSGKQEFEEAAGIDKAGPSSQCPLVHETSGGHDIFDVLMTINSIRLDFMGALELVKLDIMS